MINYDIGFSKVMGDFGLLCWVVWYKYDKKIYMVSLKYVRDSYFTGYY